MVRAMAQVRMVLVLPYLVALVANLGKAESQQSAGFYVGFAEKQVRRPSPRFRGSQKVLRLPIWSRANGIWSVAVRENRAESTVQKRFHFSISLLRPDNVPACREECNKFRGSNGKCRGVMARHTRPA